jgi:integrase
MGRPRKAIDMKKETNVYVARYWHPTRERTERIALDESAGVAEKKLDYLNLIFMNKDNWNNPPEGFADIRAAWLGPDSEIRTSQKQARKGKTAIVLSAGEVAYWKGEAEFWKDEYHALLSKYNARGKELEHWRGKKLRTGPCPKLADACNAWLGKYQGRDSDHTKIVGYDLKRFVNHFGSMTDPAKDVTADELDGREQDIDAWLRGLKTKDIKDAAGKVVKPGRPISAGRRQQIRRIVLRFLEDSGVGLKRKAVATISRKQVRAGRGAIRWLEREQAEKVAKLLAQPWQDLFRVQVGLGLRPDELATLKRADFSTDFAELSISPLDHLTLKQGSRKLRVPADIREILKPRMPELGAVAFPDPETKKPWANVKDYNRAYNAALKAAGGAAGVPFTMDCRIGRRTCGSLLLRSGMSAESVAAILGDDVKTVTEHYARILSKEVDPSAAVLALQ